MSKKFWVGKDTQENSCEVKEKRLETYQANGVTSITHLMYADDILIFTKANQKSPNTIKFMLTNINTDKSTAIFSKIYGENPDLHHIIGFQTKKFAHFIPRTTHHMEEEIF